MTAPRRRMAVGGIAIESCTFSPLRTRREDFHELRLGADVLGRHPHLGRAPFADRPDLEWIGLLHARALPGGVVVRDAYEGLKADLLARLDVAGPLDGFLLDLHGAMAVEGVDDPEADLAAAVRARLGPGAVLAACLDLHGNVSAELVAEVDLITAYRTAPHEDVLATREKACRMLADALDRGLRPARAWCAIPVLLPGECTSTRAEPARSLYARLAESDALPGVLDASLWIGYVWADTPRSTASVVVTALDAETAAAEAEAIARRVWEARREFRFEVPAGPLDEGLDLALRAPAHPFFISDSGDNPTAGGAGDIPQPVAQILRRPEFASGAARAVYASIPDAAAIRACQAAGVGGRVRAEIGGKLDPIHGRPLPVEGVVERLLPGDAVGGDMAVLRCGGLAIILTSRRKPFHQVAEFTRLGLDPAAQTLVVVKIGYLEPELHAAARGAYLALTPGAVDQDLARLPYRRLRRPMFPMDGDFEWSPSVSIFPSRRE